MIITTPTQMISHKRCGTSTDSQPTHRKHYALALLLAALTCALPATAQKHYDANITVGAKAGAVLSRVSFSPSVPQSWNIGQCAGVTFRYTEEKHFGLIVELNIAKNGWKENLENSGYNYRHDLTYMQVPILTHIYFGSAKVKGFFNLGPQLGYMLSNKATSNFDPAAIETLPDFPTHNRYTEQMTLPVKNKFDYGLAAGLGMEVVAKRKHSIILEGRVYYGLGNVFGSNKKDTFQASSTMSVAVTLGYSFRVK